MLYKIDNKINSNIIRLYNNNSVVMLVSSWRRKYTSSFIIGVLILLLFLPSCTRSESYTKIAHFPVQENQQNQSFPHEILEKFSFTKKKSYEIIISQYKKGLGIINSNQVKIDSGIRDLDVTIRGKQTNNGGMVWDISSSNFIDEFVFRDDKETSQNTLSMAYGVGSKNYVIEKNKEYVLLYVVFTKDKFFQLSLTEPFSDWPNYTNKEEFLNSFEYAYLLTVSSK